ncbi:N-alpha-acetyltransferase 20 [Portunus trituberculatus]|uniref:N-alpha-acetyltransferase 20 n=1 Tax=Portunus trituberculatus TaxID=210409 RepID=A0A5B7FG02_PORTR|nr:N-alpha-acetyltransferase 20 [Portunus trituberculatus]
MTTLRPFRCEDMFHFNNVNLDPLTETYGLSFYLQYLAHWPEYFQVAESSSGVIMGYIGRSTKKKNARACKHAYDITPPFAFLCHTEVLYGKAGRKQVI